MSLVNAAFIVPAFMGADVGDLDESGSGTCCMVLAVVRRVWPTIVHSIFGSEASQRSCRNVRQLGPREIYSLRAQDRHTQAQRD